MVGRGKKRAAGRPAARCSHLAIQLRVDPVEKTRPQLLAYHAICRSFAGRQTERRLGCQAAYFQDKLLADCDREILGFMDGQDEGAGPPMTHSA